MTDRPNILLITADQWRADHLGAAGHPLNLTPHLDAFAGDAVRFANHFAPCAPCSPARASLYTGLYQMNHRVVTNGAPLDDRFDNMARAARRAGYDPTLFGYTDTALDPRGRPADDPELDGYENVLPGFSVGQILREDDATWIDWLRERGRSGPFLDAPHAVPPAADGGVSLAPPDYGPDETQTAFLTERLLDWIDMRDTGAPWFGHLSFLRPHPPFVVPDPYASLFSPADMPEPITASLGNVAPTHPLVQALRHRPKASGYQPGLAGSTAQLSPADALRLRAIYCGMVAEVDAQIGKIFAALKARGLWDNTLVIVTSDHGEMLGDYGLFGKGGFYPQSQHIPLMIRMPGGAAGQVVTRYTSSVDLFPTLLEIWGLAPRHAPDGHSLSAFLNGKTPAAWRAAALWEFDFRAQMSETDRAALGLDSRACHLLARIDDEHFYVHSPAFAPLLFERGSDPQFLTDRSNSLPEQRLAVLDKLVTERMRLNDNTLADLRLPLDPARRID